MTKVAKLRIFRLQKRKIIRTTFIYIKKNVPALFTWKKTLKQNKTKNKKNSYQLYLHEKKKNRTGFIYFTNGKRHSVYYWVMDAPGRLLRTKEG